MRALIDDLELYPDGRPVLLGPECRRCHSKDLACMEHVQRADGFELTAYRCRACGRRTTFTKDAADAVG